MPCMACCGRRCRASLPSLPCFSASIDTDELIQFAKSINHQVIRQSIGPWQVMLDEIKDHSASSEQRYKAALDGQSLGTHSVGSSAGAVAIQRPDQGGAATAAGAAAAAGQQPDKGKAH